ncbi:MAG: TrkA family potassium uptake protein [Sedimentisphaerales bacterium]|nr:TrkA family potassium uptake protein [Sedimentisphaerales bacterium]
MLRFAVIGLGRFGAQLARSLTRSGVEVIAIDKDQKIIDQIAPDVTMAVRLDSTEDEALRAQGVDKVDAVIIGIGQDFEANVLTTVTVKSLGVKHICARADSAMHGKILRRIGADEIIYPEDESALRWSFKLTAPQIGEKLEFAPGFSLGQYSAPASFAGKTVKELNLRKKYHVNLISLRRSDTPVQDGKKVAREVINVPLPDTVINEGDILWLVGSDENLSALPMK